MDERTRHLLDAAAQRGERAPDAADTAMVALWLSTPAPADPPGLGRYAAQLWRDRVDLQEAYPGVSLDPRQRAEYRRWFVAFAGDETDVPASVVDDARALDPRDTTTPSAVADTAQPGVTVVGHFRAVLGIAAAARRVADLLEASGERVHRRTYDHTGSPATVPFLDLDDGGRSAPRLDVTLLCINGAQTPRLARALGPRALTDTYRIGLWFWELDVFPPTQAAGLDHLDEVWVTSEYVRDAVSSVAPPRVRVEVLPLGLGLLDLGAGPHDPATLWDRLGLFVEARTKVVGFTFDHASRVSRKNPHAVIEAYRLAVPVADPARTRLVIKTVGARDFPDADAALRRAANGRSDIQVIDAVLSEHDQQVFLASLSALVSLHRSEGYGLTMLEAMARRVPVVATGYGGNLAFMTVDNAWLVPYDLVAVHDGDGPYAVEGARWADAVIADAAAALGEILADSPESQETVRTRIDRAQQDVAPLVDGSAATAWLRQRLDALRAERAR